MPAARRQPPRRGVPFYDVDRGRTRILPRQGGPVVDYVGPSERRGFDARAALRRSGLAARSEAGSAARGAGRVASTAGFDTGSWTNLILWVLATILMLGLLRALLEGQGPAAAQTAFGWLGQAWGRFFSASDPIIGKGPATAAGVPARATAGATTSAPAGGFDPPDATRTGRLVPVPGDTTTRSGVRLDAGVAPTAEAIARRFGLKISSGFRDPAHNAEVGGAPRSDHLAGTAADFVGPADAMRALQRWAERSLGTNGISYVEPWSQTGGTHVHISFARGRR